MSDALNYLLKTRPETVSHYSVSYTHLDVYKRQVIIVVLVLAASGILTGGH